MTARQRAWLGPPGRGSATSRDRTDSPYLRSPSRARCNLRAAHRVARARSAARPEILVVTGDLTHRGRRPELELARELLESLALPFLAVPGNHDIPYALPTRFTRTRAEWERVFGTAEPVYTSERLAIVGLNSVRPWRQQGGAVEGTNSTAWRRRSNVRRRRRDAWWHFTTISPHRRGGRPTSALCAGATSPCSALRTRAPSSFSAVTSIRAPSRSVRSSRRLSVISFPRSFSRRRPALGGHDRGVGERRSGSTSTSRRGEHLGRYVVMVGPDVRRGRSAYVSAGNGHRRG